MIAAQQFEKFVAHLNASAVDELPPTLVMYEADGTFIATVPIEVPAWWSGLSARVANEFVAQVMRATLRKFSAGAYAVYDDTQITLVPGPVTCEAVLCHFECLSDDTATRVYPHHGHPIRLAKFKDFDATTLSLSPLPYINLL